MSEWEVVSSKKKTKIVEKVEPAPTLEEIMPTQQYRNLFAGKVTKNSPAKSSSSSTKSKSPKKQPPEAKKPKQQLQHVPVRPKSLEAALRGLTPEDFEGTLAQLKLTYPGSELLWLKGVAAFLNASLPFDCDPTFGGKSANYPSNVATQQFKNNVVYFLETVGVENLSYFYQTLLVNMTMDLCKNAHIVGYKFLLQLIGTNWPEICANNLAKTALLRNSYQNRSNVCLSILWAIGQGGYRELEEGIKVWHNILLPCLELKSYSKFVIEYMERILTSAADQSLSMNQAEFFMTYNALRATYSGLSRDLQDSLGRSAALFLQKYIDNTSKHANVFLTLLGGIEDPHRNSIEMEGCIRCLVRSTDDCCKILHMNYKKRMQQSTLLINKIIQELSDSAAPLASSNTFQKFLEDTSLLKSAHRNHQRRNILTSDPYMDEMIESVRSLHEKSAAQQKRNKQSGAGEKKKCGCCKWVLGSILLVALIGAVLAYDTQVNGKGVFARSTVGKTLQQAGVLPHVEKAWYTSMSAAARAYKWGEQHVPPYARPAGKLACDVWKLGRNTACNAFGALRDLVSAKLPVAAKFLEQYVPGLPKKIENSSVAVRNVFVDVYAKTWAFLQTQVLVGRLSPENLGKFYNETQNLALEYLHLFHKKVDAYAKLK